MVVMITFNFYAHWLLIGVDVPCMDEEKLC